MTTAEINKIIECVEIMDNMNDSDKRVHSIANFMHNILDFDSTSIHFVDINDFEKAIDAYDATIDAIKRRIA